MTENSTENLVLSGLIYNDEYFKKVFPFLKQDYFEDKRNQVVYNEILEYFSKYKKIPTKESILIDIENRNDLTDDDWKKIKSEVKEYKKPEVEIEWLIDHTEKFVQSRALYLAMTDSISIMQGENKKVKKEAIPDILKDALSICFDPNVGHDYFNDIDKRYEKYNEVLERIKFKLPYFNKITHGGVPKKTLNILAAGTNSFKSGTLCDFASFWLYSGLNVLYISMEMSEESVAERIDANLMALTIQEVKTLPKGQFFKKVKEIESKTNGKLIIKEYPTATVHVGHFRALLSELEIKKSFRPDIIVVDYLNICVPMRFKTDSLYSANKAIAEELRGLAVEYNLPLWTATQLTRGGQSSSDPSLENVSESHGVAATADFMLALVMTEELDEKNMIMIKQLKNRYNDKAKDKKTMLGVDKARMTLYELDSKITYNELNDPKLKDVENEVETQFNINKKQLFKSKVFNYD